MEMKLPRLLKNTKPFSHDNLIQWFNDSKKNKIFFESYNDFMNYYHVHGCNTSELARDKPKTAAQYKQFVVNHFGKLRKVGYDFDEIIKTRPISGTVNKFIPKKQGVKKVAKKKIKIQKESVNVLNECIELQLRKSQDYQNPNSNIKQAMHYRRGVDTIHDMIHQKLLRAQSLLEAEGDPKFESLEDTYKDMINYCSFAVSYMRGKMEGQDD
tara:strand:+ start:33 stop:668 length:636 start_codon:yes stop_codon:yes gene_type:complete